MPDDRSFFGPSAPPANSWKAALPPILMALGAASLFRTSRTLSLGLLGALLFDVASASDNDQRTRRLTKREINRKIDIADEDSFPASDPPSYTGTISGAPES